MSEEQDLIEDEELDLSTLPDDELVLQMHDDLYDGLKEEIEEGTNILLERGWAEADITAYLGANFAKVFGEVWGG